MTKMIQVVDVFEDGGVQTTGTPQLQPVDTVVGESTGMTPAANIAAVAVPFADLTAAANAHNALLSALKAAGLMVAD